jgi:hypothetical protein
VVFTFLVAVTATALVVFTFAVAATALVVFTFTVVVTALMAFAVVMMIAVCACVHKLTAQICSYCLVRVAGSAGADLDARIGERVQGAAAKTAADQNLDIMVCQKSCQCAVADSIRSNDFTGYDGAVLYLIYLEIFCSSKVLEDIAIFIRCCDFHSTILSAVFRKHLFLIVAQ